MKIFPNNKKGATLTGWTEGILLSLLFVIILAGVIGNFNVIYNQSHQIGLGTNTTEMAMRDYEDTLQSQVEGGEVDFNSQTGITLKSSWGIIKQSVNIIWNFITGGWIEQTVEMMKLPVYVAVIFRILYFLSLGFIILKILFKVRP